MSARRERQLGIITPNLQRYDAAKAADWLDAIERQVCPFCNAGPFVVVAQHVYQIHGIDRLTLRDMLGLGTHSVICDPLYSQGRKAHAEQLHRQGKLNAGTQPEDRGRKRRMTNVMKIALDRQRPALLKRLNSPDVIRRRDEALQSSIAQRREERSPRDESVINRLTTTAESVRTVARSVGIGRTTVRRIARDHGIDVEERALRIGQEGPA